MLSPRARAFSVEALLATTRDDDAGKGPEGGGRGPTPGCRATAQGAGPSALQSAYDQRRDREVTIELCHRELWNSFHLLETEMIITKSGRRMFPALRVRVLGLDPSSSYQIYMDFIPVDKNKYRYVYHSSKWMVAGTGDSMIPNQMYEHPESPMIGSYIMSQVISFEKVKLTNSDTPKKFQVSLISMQRFLPRVRIVEVNEDFHKRPAKRGNEFLATFPQTSFMAVTAYQNQEVTRLKIARNPFAKGFREANKHRSSLEAMMASFGAFLSPRDAEQPAERLGSGLDSDAQFGRLQRDWDPTRTIMRPVPTRLLPPPWDDGRGPAALRPSGQRTHWLPREHALFTAGGWNAPPAPNSDPSAPLPRHQVQLDSGWFASTRRTVGLYRLPTAARTVARRPHGSGEEAPKGANRTCLVHVSAARREAGADERQSTVFRKK